MRSGWPDGPALLLPGSTGFATRYDMGELRCSCAPGTARPAGGKNLPGWREICGAPMTLTADELGAAFGRDRIVHAAVGGGKLCRRLLLDLEKLAGLRVAAPADRSSSRPGAAR